MRTHMEKMAQTQKRHSFENRGQMVLKSGFTMIHLDKFFRKVYSWQVDKANMFYNMSFARHIFDFFFGARIWCLTAYYWLDIRRIMLFFQSLLSNVKTETGVTQWPEESQTHFLWSCRECLERPFCPSKTDQYSLKAYVFFSLKWFKVIEDFLSPKFSEGNSHESLLRLCTKR